MFFLNPSMILVIAPSQSGKTYLVNQLIKDKDRYFGGEPIKHIIYCYQSIHSIDQEVKNLPNITFVQGAPENEDIPNNSLVFLDDYQTSDLNNEIVKLFTIFSHHKKFSLILPIHHLYAPNPYLRTISSNSTHLIVFKSPRYSNTFTVLARQLTSNHRNLVKVFNKITEASSYGHLCVDLTPKCKEFNRYKSNILDKSFAECYVTSNCLSRLEKYQLPDGNEIFFGEPFTTS